MISLTKVPIPATLTQVAVGDKLIHLGGQPVETALASEPDGLPDEVVADPRRWVYEVTAKPTTGCAEAEGWTVVIRDVTEEQAIQERLWQQERLAALEQFRDHLYHLPARSVLVAGDSASNGTSESALLAP